MFFDVFAKNQSLLLNHESLCLFQLISRYERPVGTSAYIDM